MLRARSSVICKKVQPPEKIIQWFERFSQRKSASNTHPNSST